MSDTPSAPAAPDYTAAANATAAGNLDAARAAAAANRVNQYTPYGNLIYSHDANAASPDDGWSATTQLSDAQQQLLNSQNQTSLGLSSLANQGLGYVQNALASPVTADSLQAALSKYLPADSVNAGQTGQDALMARFQPLIDQQNNALQAQLANQGITLGSDAYNNAMRVQQQGDNDLRSQAALNGISVGQQAQTQKMNLLQSELAQQTALQNNPINVLNAVRSGSQVTNPTFTSVPQQATTAGPDLTSAANSTNNYNMGLYNSQTAANNSTTGGLFGLGASALLSPAGTFSKF